MHLWKPHIIYCLHHMHDLHANTPVVLLYDLAIVLANDIVCSELDVFKYSEVIVH